MVEAARIAEALAGKAKGKNQLAEVTAGDVIAVAGAVPAERQTKVTAALLKGATAAGEEARVFQKADDLFALLDAAGAA